MSRRGFESVVRDLDERERIGRGYVRMLGRTLSLYVCVCIGGRRTEAMKDGTKQALLGSSMKLPLGGARDAVFAPCKNVKNSCGAITLSITVLDRYVTYGTP